ncbi:MAG: S8 family serine peptidase [Candidatus Sericytochromatia bacterium]
MNKLSKIMFLSTFFVISCSINNIKPSIDIKNNKNEIFSYKKNLIESLKEKYKNTPKYSGDIDIKINTGLLNNNKEDKKVFQVSSYNFDLKSIPEGNIVFQDTFTIENNKVLDLEKRFKINDKNKKYTIYLKKITNNNENIEGFIKINNNDILNNKNFNFNNEFTNDLTLNENNDIKINLKSKNKFSFNIVIVEGKTNDYIRRKDFLLGNHAINDNHVKSKDINIFDPRDKNSLSNFDIYYGDITDGKTSVSSIFVNDVNTVEFETGILLVKFKDESFLEVFKNLYGATVEEKIDDVYKLKLNLDKAPIDDLDTLIKNYNNLTFESIKSASFSSLASLKTFSILFDFVTKYRNSVYYVELNSFLEPQVEEVETNDLASSEKFDILYDFYDFYGNKKIEQLKGDGIWMKEMNVTKAWNYSIGSNIFAAHIDNSFKNPDIIKNPEIPPNRIHIDPSSNIDQNSNNIDNGYAPCYHGNYHGQACIQVAYGERNNLIASSGTAPNTKVFPIAAGQSSVSKELSLASTAKAFKLAIDKKVDLISFSSGHHLFSWWIFSDNDVNSDFILGINNGNTMVGKILDAVKANIPVILSAGNDADNIDNFSPPILGNRSKSDGIIVVGGVGKNNNILKATLFQELLKKDLGSNWDLSNNLVWAFWEQVYTAAYRPVYNQSDNKCVFLYFNDPKPVTNVDGNQTGSFPMSFGGTSSSCPQVAGIVSLMKSRNKSLEAGQIEQILKETSSKIVKKHEKMPNDVKLVDALAAVEEAIRQRKIEPKTPDAFIPYSRYVYATDKFYDNENAQDVYFLDEGVKSKIFYTNYLDDAKKQSLKNKVLDITAWDKGTIENNIRTNNLEILSFKEIDLSPKINNIACSYFNNICDSSNSHILKASALITILGKDLFPSLNTAGRIAFKNTATNKTFILDLSDALTSFTPLGDTLYFYLDAAKSKADDGSNLSDEIKINGNKYYIFYEGFNNKITSNLEEYEIKSDFTFKTSIAFSGGIADIVFNKPTTSVTLKAGGAIAVPINQSLEEKIRKGLAKVSIGGVNLTLLEIIQNYAIYGIPNDILNNPDLRNSINNGLLDIIITNGIPNSINKNGDPLMILKEALKVVSTSIGLNPTYPDGYPPTSKLPWVEFNKTIDVRKGEIYNLPMLNLGSKPTITAKNVNFIFKSYDSSKVTIEVPKNAEYGIQDVNVNENGVNYVFPNAINVLEDKTTAINGVSTVKDSNGNNVPVVGIGTQTTVVPADRVAISLTQLLSKDLSNSSMYIAGRKLTFLEILQNYAIYGIPSDILTNNDAQNNIKGVLQELIIKNNLGETVQSFADALKVVSVAIGLNPKYPDGTPPVNQVPFLENNLLNEANRRKNIRRGNKFALSIRGLNPAHDIQVYTGSGYRLNVAERNGEYVTIELPYNLPLGNQNVYLHESNSASGDDIDFKNSLNVLVRDDIVFDSGRDGNEEIYLMKPDGANQTRITNNPSIYDYAPDWNPEKTQIQYRELNANDYIDICTINPDGTGFRNLTNTPSTDEYSVTYSPNGSRFAYTSYQNGQEDIWVMNNDGSNKINLTSGSLADDYEASWSPDGSKIVFISERDGSPEVYIMNADGSNQTRLTQGATDNNSPVFLPDNSKIIYVSETRGDGTDQLWMMNPDGTGKEQLTFEDDYNPQVSPDGKKIMYQKWINANNIQGRVIDLETRAVTSITTDSFRTFTTGWLVDGSKGIFTSNVSGGNEIYTIKPDGTDLLRLTFNNSRDHNGEGFTFGTQNTKISKTKKQAKKIKHFDERLVKPKRFKK